MITFKRFDFLLASPDEWLAYHSFRRKINSEQTPDEPIMSDKATQISQKVLTASYKMHIWQYGIFLDGPQIGYLYWAFLNSDSPSYKGNEKTIFYEIKILNSYQRKGIGTQSLQILLHECEKYGKEIFLCECIIPEAQSFFEAIGAKIALVHHENKLLIKNVERSLLLNWINEGKERNPNTILRIFETSIPDQYVSEFAKSFTESGMDEPKGELVKGEDVLTVEQIREEEKLATASGIKIFTCMTIENDGKVSGATQLKKIPGRQTILSQSFTGVPKRYNGRKLAKWVKAEMLLYVKEHYPECEAIKTRNAEMNGAMLHINNSLGYKKYKELKTYQISSVQLKNYLHSKIVGPYEII